MEKKRDENFDRFLKLTPLFTGVIIFSSFLNKKMFYNNFSLNIEEYIELSELIKFFLNDSILIVSLFVNYPAIYFYLRSKSFKEFFGNKLNFKSFIFIAIGISIQVLGMYLFVDYFIEFTIMNKWSLILSILLLHLTQITISCFVVLAKEVYRKITLLILFILISQPIVGYGYGRLLKEIGNNKCYSFYLENGVIETNKDVLFIGRTKDFIFIHNKYSNKTKVLRSEDVKKNEIQICN